MDNSFSSLINSANSILVLLPQSPNFDQVAAGLSFYLTLSAKKTTSVSCASPMVVDFNRLIGIDKITSEIGNKNLTIKFKSYDAANIEKVSYDIVNGEFNLTVVPKIGFLAPQKDQMEMSFSGISADLIILVSGSTENDFPILTSPELNTAKIVHVGNRQIVSTKQILSFAKPSATICELVTGLVKEISPVIDADTASNLVMGIEEGSSNFTSSEVTADTFETFAYLLRSGGRRMVGAKLSSAGFPPGSIPNQPFNVPQHQTPVVNVDPILSEVEGKEEMGIENPPDDWLQPKLFKGANSPMGQSDSFSENKG